MGLHYLRLSTSTYFQHIRCWIALTIEDCSIIVLNITHRPSYPNSALVSSNNIAMSLTKIPPRIRVEIWRLLLTRLSPVNVLNRRKRAPPSTNNPQRTTLQYTQQPQANPPPTSHHSLAIASLAVSKHSPQR